MDEAQRLTSLTSVVAFISKPMIFMAPTYVVPTLSTGPLNSENLPRGIQSPQCEVSQ